MKEPVFIGSCTAMITPFNEHGIDFERLGKQIEFQGNNGTSAIVIAGTTGEIATLTDREYETLAVFSVREASPKMKVILGIGGNNTEKCVSNARFAKLVGADAVLMTTPYYNKTSVHGLEKHFLSVADSVDIPIILYNVPSRTGIGIPGNVYRLLAEHPNINGTKEASGDFSLISELAASCAGTLWIWSGNDDHTISMMALGAQGVISVASNILPAEVAKLCQLCLKNEYAAAGSLFSKYADLFRTLFIETNPIPVKAAMHLLGTDSGILRRPLVPISDAHLNTLRESMKNAGIL